VWGDALFRRNSLRGPSNLSPARSLRPSGSFGASGSGAAAGFAGSSGNTSGSLDEQQVARLQVRVERSIRRFCDSIQLLRLISSRTRNKIAQGELLVREMTASPTDETILS